MGLEEVWTDCDEHREYLLEASYRQRVGGASIRRGPSMNTRGFPSAAGIGYCPCGAPPTSRFSGPSKLRRLVDKSAPKRAADGPLKDAASGVGLRGTLVPFVFRWRSSLCARRTF